MPRTPFRRAIYSYARNFMPYLFPEITYPDCIGFQRFDRVYDRYFSRFLKRCCAQICQENEEINDGNKMLLAF